MTPQLTWETHDGLPPEAAVVDAGLGAANESAAPMESIGRLTCVARAADAEVIGGAVGRTWGECCELQQLWVHTAHRRRGVGAELVRRFEQRARERGCRVFYLETFSFQAPSLYRSLGYRTAKKISGFPGGIIKHLMMKVIGD